MKDIDHKTPVPAPVSYGNEILKGEQLYVLEEAAKAGDIILTYEDKQPVWIGRVQPGGEVVDQYGRIHKSLPETYQIIRYVLHQISRKGAEG